jgi:hypothetical protein
MSLNYFYIGNKEEFSLLMKKNYSKGLGILKGILKNFEN